MAHFVTARFHGSTFQLSQVQGHLFAMTTTQTFSTRISSLSDSNKSTLHLIQRLAKLNFQPGSVPFNGDKGDVLSELSSEIHESLKQQEEELELLKQEVEELNVGHTAGNRRGDSERDRERTRLSVQVVRLGEDLKSLRSSFRQAQLQAKRSAEQAKQKERELLFAGAEEGNGTAQAGRRRGKELTKDELVANASSDVTAALRRTHQLMQSELTRSRFAQETLEQSSAALTDLSERYTSLDSLLSASRNLLGTLVRSQKSDSWYLETALYILIFTVVWILFRRLLFGFLWVFAWIPLKYSTKLLAWIVSAGGFLGGASSTALASQSTRTPLIVKPSATDKPPRINKPNKPASNYYPAGGGGYGAKVGAFDPREDPSPPGSMSQQVGKMAEGSRQEQEQKPVEGSQKAPESGDREPVRRGDGETLVESDKPRNPKKKMWDEDQERAKYEKSQQETEKGRRRDEL